jgi:hypothetical protein
MRKSKTAFNIEEMFLEGQHTPETMREFASSQLFPIAAAIYSACNKQTRIGKITKDFRRVHRANILTVNGFMVAVITYDGDEFEVCHPIRSTEDAIGACWIKSKSSGYIRNKLLKDTEHPAYRIRETVKEADHSVSSAVRYTLDQSIDRIMGAGVSRRPEIELSKPVTAFLSDVVMGKASMSEMSCDMRTEFEDRYAAYTHMTAKFDEAVDRVKDMFGNGKWAYIPDINGGVVLGGLSSEGAVKALDLYKRGSALPWYHTHNLATFDIAPKWYPSHEAIPEEYRCEVDYALLMLKAHRNSDALFPSVFHEIWADIGASMDNSTLLLPR